MNIDKIISDTFPITSAHKKCWVRRQALEDRRRRLKILIEKFNRGEVVNWASVGIGPEIEKTLKSPA